MELVYFTGNKHSVQNSGLNKCYWKQRSLRKAIPKLKHLKPTTRGISRRSPIQVLTSLYRVWLRWSDENRYFFCDVVVGERAIQNLAIWVAWLALKLSGMYAFVLLLFFTCRVKLGSGLFSTRHGLFPFLETIPVLRNGNEVLAES